MPSDQVEMRVLVMSIRLLLSIVGSVAVVSLAHARERNADPSPFAHAPCSVLESGPCTPSVCSVLRSGPCFPEITYPAGENLQVTLVTRASDGKTMPIARPPGHLNTLGDLFAALRACWQPPPVGQARAEMQITVKVSFKRGGALFAAPTVTFATPGITAEVRKLYRNAVVDSLNACTPFNFTDALGGAIAGRPILVRYVDRRVKARQAEGPPPQ